MLPDEIAEADRRARGEQTRLPRSAESACETSVEAQSQWGPWAALFEGGRLVSASLASYFSPDGDDDSDDSSDEQDGVIDEETFRARVTTTGVAIARSMSAGA